MIKLRLTEPRDAEAVTALVGATMQHSESDAYPAEVLEPLIEYFTSQKISQLAHDRHFLVAEEGDKLVGAAALDGGELAAFFVHPGYQRRGVGAQLLQALEKAAADQGLSRLVVRANLASSAFYERMGYRKTGTILSATGITQIGMEKPLS
jgi:N-acetylglutamate synthase-like GNAT family acetyltransferase